MTPPSERRNCRTWEFLGLLAGLPEGVRELAAVKFRLFEADPSHPSLHHKPIRHQTARPGLREGTFSVRLNVNYRALYFVDEQNGTNVWYWIGSHAEYNHIVGCN